MRKSTALLITLMMILLLLSGCSVPSDSSGSSTTSSSELPEPPVLTVGLAEGTQRLLPVLSGAVGQASGLYVSDNEASLVSASEQFVPELAILPENVAVEVRYGEELVLEGDFTALQSFSPVRRGTYDYLVSANNGGWYYEYRFSVDFEPPIRMVCSSNTISLGQIVVVRVLFSQPDAEVVAKTELCKTLPDFYCIDGQLIGLFPASYKITPGTYDITVSSEGVEQTFAVVVEDRAFDSLSYTVDPKITAETKDSSKANEEFNGQMEPLWEIYDPVKYWDGPFAEPVVGEITQTFGTFSYINGQKSSARHDGIDIAAKTGTPVIAPAAGRVLFAGYLQLSGYTIVIEHGLGVKTRYYHLDSISVAQGQMVEQNQQLGEVGSTGFSTGPHLHFSVSVGKVFIDPEEAYRADLLPNV